MFKAPSYSDIVRAYRLKGYRFFKDGLYNVNIMGIRSKVSESNQFDDYIVIAYLDENGENVRVYPATTDPGKYFLQNPLVAAGTLILVSGQYKGAYKVGLHGRSRSNPYKALEQIRPMKYVRDNNRDSIVDISLIDKPENHIVGNFKTNIHRAHQTVFQKWVGRYSAGCQVIQRSEDFDEFMGIVELSRIKYGNSFTYTLFNEHEIV